MKAKTASVIGALSLGLTCMNASADFTVKWTTVLAPGSHPENVYYDKAQKKLYASKIVGGDTDIDKTSAGLEVLDKGETAIIPFLAGDKTVAYRIE